MRFTTDPMAPSLTPNYALATAWSCWGSRSNEGPLKHLYVTPKEIGGRVTSPLYLIVRDCEGAYARALAAKAEVIVEMKTMEYGGKAFTVRDPEGYLWSVG